MNSKLERFKNEAKVVLNTQTKEIANKLMQWCDNNGIKLASGRSPTVVTLWEMYKEETCYRFNEELTFSYISYYENNDYEVLELTLEDFKEDKNMFTKSDLKTGMVVELANGNKYMVLTGDLPTHHYGRQNILFVDGGSGFITGKNYNEEMIYERNNGYNIVAVYSTFLRGISYVINDTNESTLIWKRKQEVNWSKVAIDTKVLVKDDGNDKWKRRYFAGFDNGGNTLVFNNGTTSFTRRGAKDTCSCWDEMVLYEGNEYLVEEAGERE